MENKKKFVINVVYLTIIVAICYLVYKYALPYLLPFAYGGLIAMLFNGPISYLEKKGANRSLASIVIILGFYLVLIVLIVLLGVKLVYDCIDIVDNMPTIYREVLEPIFYKWYDDIGKIVKNLDPTVVSNLQSTLSNLISSIGEWISSFSMRLVSSLTKLITQAPLSIVKILLTVISSVYCAIDYKNFKDFILRQMSSKLQKILNISINYVKRTIKGCLYSYGIIMGITFVELSIGFIIFNKDNIFLLAGLIALVDIMPVLGCGTVLIPWSVIAFITGNIKVGIEMAILYGIIYVIRQVIEPKIVGGSLGLHPIIALASMFIGTQIFGGIGIFAGPILASLIVYLNKEGYIKLYR